MAAAVENFDEWLKKKLESLNTDVDVFGGYIRGILESDESLAEKREALEELISSVTENDIDSHVSEILGSWNEFFSKVTSDAEDDPVEDVEVRLARMMESKNLPTVAKKSYSAEDRKLRDAIIKKYGEVAEGKSDEDEDGDEENGSETELEKNMNAATIVQQEKEKRERTKLESQKKKDKDKEDREKQIKLREEKKEKRKTQKVERRR
ncbi:GSCOCG00012275001-RA-CDS [Cotesia congregata]|uniref:Coiled-coil domain-containing protein 43 n=1 Tax=Cotesia congregata TaxID=51543 RepID=A0A8J2HJD1_COTCN|nr:GSCOCG00000491001-RA-CDS [Cotesia congregata]CAD6233261.1 GSCOCG00012275001-RA-CDS [Cotesia congregata]CAG5087860.1 Similar to ccdc43: Coiled-coil domain-containing protein 43 (Danio rerio) [Cotesia congregata]CAG5093264.1 Similar to ccdc43: Coiled-coil domain-containing protein 43 (Danio rerio) [Cotesia congregata]